MSERRVFSIETEREKDLQTLAATEAKCAYALQSGSCTLDMCEHCTTRMRLDNCLSELPDCDRLRVSLVADQVFAQMKFQYPIVSKKGKVLKTVGECAGAIGGSLAACAGMVLLLIATVAAFSGLIFWALHAR